MARLSAEHREAIEDSINRALRAGAADEEIWAVCEYEITHFGVDDAETTREEGSDG